MKKRFLSILSLVLALLMTFLLSACGATPAPPADDPAAAPATTPDKVYTVIFGHVENEESPAKVGVEALQAYIEENAGGRLDVQVYPNAILGGERELVESMNLGSVQMSFVSSAIFGTYDAKYDVAELPYLFNDYTAFNAAMDGEFGEQIGEWLAEDGFTYAGAWSCGFRGLSNSKRAVHSPADMEGLKIRVMESELYIDTFTLLGANPTPMSFSEVYTGLQQKTIDGQDNGPSITVSQKFHEIQPYYTLMRHTPTTAIAVVSSKFLESLPEDLQQILRDGMKVMETAMRESYANDEAVALEKMRTDGVEVVELTPEETAVFREAVAPVHEKFRSLVGDEMIDFALSCN